MNFREMNQIPCQRRAPFVSTHTPRLSGRFAWFAGLLALGIYVPTATAAALHHAHGPRTRAVTSRASAMPALVPNAVASASAVQMNGRSEMLHITAGRSMMLDVPRLLRRVYVSNPAVLSSLTSSPSQLLITAKSPGVSSLVLWDSYGQSTIYTVSVDVDVEGLGAALRTAFPHDEIQATALQDRVTLNGLVSAQETVDAAVKLTAPYAKDVSNSLRVAPAHQKQVRLKVRIAEVDRSRAEQLGINFIAGGSNIIQAGTQEFSSFAGGAIGSTAAATGITVGNPLNFLFYNVNSNVGASIADLEQKQVLQILSEPTITSLSGEPASFLSGGEFPFPVVQGGAGSFVSVSIQFRPYGVKLDFTPYVNPDGTIRLKVAPEVSALDYTNAVQISGFDVPAIATRRAQTQVELKDGQSFAISGLLDRRLTDMFNRMPGIASVPVLGALFKSKSVTTSTVELIVIVTPEIVDPLSGQMPPPDVPVVVKPYMDSQHFDQQVNKKKKD